MSTKKKKFFSGSNELLIVPKQIAKSSIAQQ